MQIRSVVVLHILTFPGKEREVRDWGEERMHVFQPGHGLIQMCFPDILLFCRIKHVQCYCVRLMNAHYGWFNGLNVDAEGTYQHNTLLLPFGPLSF